MNSKVEASKVYTCQPALLFEFTTVSYLYCLRVIQPAPHRVQPERKVDDVMQWKDEAGRCKGKIGKKGNTLLIERGATEESCKLACSKHKKCKFATLQKKGPPTKWKCASFKKCKMNKNKKFITFKKSAAPKPAPTPTPKPDGLLAAQL